MTAELRERGEGVLPVGLEVEDKEEIVQEQPQSRPYLEYLLSQKAKKN